MNIVVVPVADIDNAWPHVAERFVKCIEKVPTYLTAGDLWQMCRSGSAFLIVALDEAGTIKGATVWQFEPHTFACRIMAGRGMADWLIPLLDVARQMARMNGIPTICADARVGFARFFKHHAPTIKTVRQTYVMEA